MVMRDRCVMLLKVLLMSRICHSFWGDSKRLRSMHIEIWIMYICDVLRVSTSCRRLDLYMNWNCDCLWLSLRLRLGVFDIVNWNRWSLNVMVGLLWLHIVLVWLYNWSSWWINMLNWKVVEGSLLDVFLWMHVVMR